MMMMRLVWFIIMTYCESNISACCVQFLLMNLSLLFFFQVETLVTAFQQALAISSSHEGDTTEAKQPVQYSYVYVIWIADNSLR